MHLVEDINLHNSIKRMYYKASKCGHTNVLWIFRRAEELRPAEINEFLRIFIVSNIVCIYHMNTAEFCYDGRIYTIITGFSLLQL